MSSSGQLRSKSGLVQFWLSLELKFNSSELDSEVGQLVSIYNQWYKSIVFYIEYLIRLNIIFSPSLLFDPDVNVWI